MTRIIAVGSQNTYAQEKKMGLKGNMPKYNQVLLDLWLIHVLSFLHVCQCHIAPIKYKLIFNFQVTRQDFKNIALDSVNHEYMP